MRYPDIYVIGAMRAGTTQFYNLLLDHPLISLPQMKELDIFRHENLSHGSLRKLLARQFESSKNIWVDVSPNYTKRQYFPDVAERIKIANSSAKFIFLARCPIARAISELVHSASSNPYEINPSDYSDGSQWRKIIDTSRYSWQLAPYLERFDRSMFIFFEFENLISHPDQTGKALSQFLGVEIEFSDSLPQAKNSSTELKAMPPIWFRIRNSPVGTALRSMVSRDTIGHVKRLVSKLPTRPPQVPEISDRNLEQMKAYLSDDAQAFRQLSGLAGKSWLV